MSRFLWGLSTCQVVSLLRTYFSILEEFKISFLAIKCIAFIFFLLLAELHWHLWKHSQTFLIYKGLCQILSNVNIHIKRSIFSASKQLTGKKILFLLLLLSFTFLFLCFMCLHIHLISLALKFVCCAYWASYFSHCVTSHLSIQRQCGFNEPLLL